MVFRHSKWWTAKINRSVNIEGYDKKFVEFIDSYVKKEDNNVS